MRNYAFSGKLIYNDLGEYEVHFSNNGKEGIVNISKILDQVYYNDNNHIKIRIVASTPKGARVVFNEDGNLLRKKDSSDIYSYHVNGEPLEEKLFYSTESYVEVNLFAEALKGRVTNHEIQSELQAV